MKKLDSTLKKCCWNIAGCLKQTRTDHLHILAGIAPPGIRRVVATQSERVRQLNYPRPPMFQHISEMSHLQSRSSFISSTAPLNDSTFHTRTCLWRNSLNAPNNTTPDMKITAVERLLDGAHLEWTIWKSLNCLRSQVGCCNTNMVKWNYTTGPDTCDCGEQQTMQYLLVCSYRPSPVTEDNLAQANYTALSAQCTGRTPSRKNGHDKELILFFCLVDNHFDLILKTKNKTN